MIFRIKIVQLTQGIIVVSHDVCERIGDITTRNNLLGLTRLVS